MKDLCIEHSGDTEILAKIGELLGAAGINIEGLSITTHNGQSIIHLVVENSENARGHLESAAILVKEISEVFILSKDRKKVTGKPGSFGEICWALSNNGIKIKFGYPAENNRFVFGVDDIAKTRQLLD